MLYFDKWKIILVALICVTGVLFSVPNFFDRQTTQSWPGWLPNQQVNLGLDLQGGAHLLFQVEVDAVVEERLENLVDGIRTVLREERIGYRGLGVDGDAATLTLRDPAQRELAMGQIGTLATTLAINPLTGVGGGSDIEVLTRGEDGIAVVLTEDAVVEARRSAVEQSVEIVRNRIDELGTREPSIQRQGDDRILVQVPGENDPQRIIDIVGTTAQMDFKLVDVTTSPADGLRGRIPPGSELLPSSEKLSDGTAAEYFVVRKRTMVSGDSLVDAQPSFQDGQPVVSFRFDSVGAKKFGDATRKNVGRPFAIVLDDEVISAPVIREPILGGSGVISGSFTVQGVNDLATLLRAGALPAPLSVLEQRAVGPSLGADSIAAGQIACIIAFLAVMVFMGMAYGIFGLVANLALIINVFIIMGALSALQATLTLPGIAGIVLTIGMAVDANVLVFERIREEINTGKTPFAAMEAGYQRAIGTILDANVTTFIAAVILFTMGSGPVKGFAVTLGIGILTSVFTAVMVSRMVLVTWLRRSRPVALPI